MFKQLLSLLFSSNIARKNEPNYLFFEDTRVSTEEQGSAKLPPIPSELKPIYERQQGEFFSYLFGETESCRQSDPIAEFISEKVAQLMSEPEALLSHLPVMPSSVTTIINELGTNNFSVNTLITIIEQEPVMAADVIKLANSSLYKKGTKDITELKRAFMLMGANGLTEGVVQIYIDKFMPRPTLYFKQFGEKIWQHALTTANFAKQIAQAENKNDGEAYLAGLISHIGTMVLFQFLIEAFSYVHPDETPKTQAFKNLLAEHQQQLTLFIARFWQLPSSILSALNNQSGSKCTLSSCVREAGKASELLALFSDGRISEEEVKSRIGQLSLTSAQTIVLKEIDKLQAV